MKKAIAVAILLLFTNVLSGCGHNSISAKTILELPKEQPVSVEVFLDDPTIEPLTIMDGNKIDTIISMLSNRTYKEVKNVTPKSNTKIILKYENGTEKIISLNGVVDSSGKKFEPVSEDELESVIISFFAND